MKFERGDLWTEWDKGAYLVVTTNVGWDPRTMSNNMGAGVALQAAMRFRGLSQWYGKLCADNPYQMPVVLHEKHRLLFFPVKPLLDINNPEISWNQIASLERISDSVRSLLACIVRHECLRKNDVVMAFPGCGNGSRVFGEVAPLLRPLQETHVRVIDRVIDDGSIKLLSELFYDVKIIDDPEPVEVKGRNKFIDDQGAPVALKPGDPMPPSPFDEES